MAHSEPTSIFDRRRFDEPGCEAPVPPPADLPDSPPDEPFVSFSDDRGYDPADKPDYGFRTLYEAGPAPADGAPEGDTPPPDGEDTDPAEPPEAAAAPAETGPEEAEPTPAEPPPPVQYSEAEMAEARRAGYDEGLQAGRDAAAADSAAKTAQTLEAIAEQLQALEQTRADEVAEAAGEAVRIAVAVVNQLFPTLRARAGEREIKAFVEKHFGDAADTRTLTVQVHEQHRDAISAQMAELAARSGYSGAVSVQADEALEPGDVRLDWREGGMERLYETLWTGIRAAVVRAIGRLEPSDKALAAKAATPPSAPPKQAGPKQASPKPAAAGQPNRSAQTAPATGSA